MISLTKTAAEQIRSAASHPDLKDLALRIAAKVNEAGMLEFGMGFDNERSDDQIVESWGMNLLISPHSAPLLDNVTIDFGEVSPGQEGFLFMMAASEPGDGSSGGGCGSGGCGSGGCGSGGCGS